MTEEHLSALIQAGDAKPADDGWVEPPEGRHFILHVSQNGASLTVPRVRALRQESGLLHAKTSNGETYIVALEDVFAGAVDGSSKPGRKAGFV